MPGRVVFRGRPAAKGMKKDEVASPKGRKSQNTHGGGGASEKDWKASIVGEPAIAAALGKHKGEEK